MQHYNLNEDGDNLYDRKFTKPYDRENELVSFTAGWLGLHSGWYVQVSKRDLCVVEFGTTKRSALRHARRAWRREWEKRPETGRGYPRVINCED